MTVTFEHRGDRRLHLRRAAPGLTPLGRIEITDVSTTGLGIRHDFGVKAGDRTIIEFTWSGMLLRLNCTVAASRKDPGSGRSQSGLIVRSGESAAQYKSRVAEALARLVARESQLPSAFSPES